MITTIIFDMGNVLINFRWKELFHEMGLEGERFERMKNATVYDPVWNEFDIGYWTDDMMEEAFIKNAPDLENEIKDMMHDRFPGLLKKFDYTDEWLDRIKAKGYRILILSNFSAKAFRDCADELDYVSKADEAVISYKVHMIKPDPKIYEYMIEKCNVVPEESVFIDDTVDNINAARSFGINTILFTGKEEADKALAEYGVIY